ncbi:MAG: tryptophan-rich sensory protein [Candidatus Magasanikbacteria bacterium]|jgi:translocator protein|nr:tryptophan-rich sensory protein [Candidatus Magasanikbacteria bacterium]MBT4314503.1 tryptophan-rich sensory protein [Candidatus Magasanikbacteria bacterium]MBT4547291.1 tryptophan-rich sensory protein [Candidatus Magasanikbacteria bacterium]MBT6818940.1 tryptophan-rich sensory protein [Candidatus Magasanikbacteria bacterium]
MFKKKKRNLKKLIIALIIPQLAGFIGSIANFTSLDTWYEGIVKPSFNPPNWIFGPVWTGLFLLMGYALYIIWEKKPKWGKNKKSDFALLIFYTQLGFNVIWSYLFFGLQNPLFALGEILVLWAVIVLNIVLFWRLDRRAGLLLFPYILWVTFAIFLNYAIFILN